MFTRQIKAALRELIDLLGQDNIREIEVERRLFGCGRVRVATGPAPTPQPVVVQSDSRSPAGGATGGSDSSTEADASPTEAGGNHTVASPLVGLFYRASSPEAPPYVAEEDTVRAGQTLCVIETMKIMNEIESDVEGRVVRILVENGQPVEYNTPLFLIEPL